ncbi:MAG: cytosolic protein, partial [Gammaproteobacteria bacterium]|nr:cytosolic protein [Gammaproteobacteria bacterium]
MSKASTQLDSPWKDILERYFEDFMLFFFPRVHALIDWEQGHEFLDTELRQVVRNAKQGRRLADKLAKVRLRSGKTAWVYAHVEVQGQFERNFNERMFVYHYRIFDRYKQQVISLAILGDEGKNWRPDRYGYKLGGCKLSFCFPVVKLLDYKDKWDELEKSNSPFSIVVRAHLKGQETRKSPEKRLHWKMRLFKSLHKAQYTQKE